MRILVTRAPEDATRTARALGARGHTVILAPLRERVLLNPLWPEGAFDALIASSRHAFSGEGAPEFLRARPVYAVGEKTAEAARVAGFGNVIACAGTSEAMTCRILADRDAQDRLLYLAGTPRHPALETSLAQRGRHLLILERYTMVQAKTLPESARASLENGAVDAVLHYSAKTARAYCLLTEAAGLKAQALVPLQLCLSSAVAAQFPASRRILIAKTPDEAALFDLLP